MFRLDMGICYCQIARWYIDRKPAPNLLWVSCRFSREVYAWSKSTVGDWGCLAATWLPGVTTRGYVENYTRYNSSSNKHAPVSRSNINDGASSVYFWFLSSAVHSMMEPRGSQWHWTTATPNLKFETRMNSVVRVNPSPKEFHGTFRLSHNW